MRKKENVRCTERRRYEVFCDNSGMGWELMVQHEMLQRLGGREGREDGGVGSLLQPPGVPDVFTA